MRLTVIPPTQFFRFFACLSVSVAVTVTVTMAVVFFLFVLFFPFTFVAVDCLSSSSASLAIDGNFAWFLTRTSGTTSQDTPWSVAVDGNTGNSFVISDVNSAATFHAPPFTVALPANVSTTNVNPNAIIISYDVNGNVRFVFRLPYGLTHYQSCTVFGNSLVVAGSSRESFNGGSPNPGGVLSNVILAQHSLTDGSFMLGHTFQHFCNENSVSEDAAFLYNDGVSLFLAATSSCSTFLGFPLYQSGSTVPFIARINLPITSNLQIQWVARTPTYYSTEQVQAMSLYKNLVYFVTSMGVSPYLTQVFCIDRESGSRNWYHTLFSSSYTSVLDVTVDSEGSLYFTGQTQVPITDYVMSNSFTFIPCPATQCFVTYAWITMKFDGNWNFLWGRYDDVWGHNTGYSVLKINHFVYTLGKSWMQLNGYTTVTNTFHNATLPGNTGNLLMFAIDATTGVFNDTFGVDVHASTANGAQSLCKLTPLHITLLSSMHCNDKGGCFFNQQADSPC